MARFRNVAVGCGLILLGGWVAYSGNCGPSTVQDPHDYGSTGLPPSAGAPHPESLVRKEIQGISRFLDKLTRDPMPEGSFGITRGGEEIGADQLVGMTITDLDRVEFHVQANEDVIRHFSAIRAQECVAPQSEDFLIPYFSRLRVRLSLADELLVPELDLLLLDSNWVQMYREGRIDRGEETFLPLTSTEHMLRTYLRDHAPVDGQPQQTSLTSLNWIKCPTDTDAEWEGVFVGGVMALLRSYSPDYGLQYSFAELSPGEEIEVRVALSLRPRLVGQLIDQDGNGVPRAPIAALVSLGMHFSEVEFYGGRELGGLATFGQPGNYYRRVDIPTKTDRLGFFSVRVPRGEAYAINCAVGESYAFASMSGPFSDTEETIRLHPQLKPSNLREGVPIRVLDDDGNAVAGVFIELSIADDFPWYRMLPILETDSEGWAGFPWIGAGTAVSPGLFGQRDRWAKPALWRADVIRLSADDIPLILRVPRANLLGEDN